MKLKPAIKKLWLDALRSGEYKQGQGFLYSRDADGNETYCCLGVLSELAVKDGVVRFLEVGTKEDVRREYISPDEKAGSASFLIHDVAEWASSDKIAGDPAVIVNNKVICLSNLNDSGSTFEEIADLIEEQM